MAFCNINCLVSTKLIISELFPVIPFDLQSNQMKKNSFTNILHLLKALPRETM